MAEFLAREAAAREGLDVETRSAGTLGLVNQAPPPNAIAVMREVGVTVQDHRSQPLSAELVDWADHVLVMTFEHAETVHTRFPNAGDKVKLLGPFGRQGQEIADPMGWWRPTYRRVRDQILRSVEGLIRNLRADQA